MVCLIFDPFFTIAMCNFCFYNIIMIRYFFLGFLIIIPFSAFTSIVKVISFFFTSRSLFLYLSQMISTYMPKCFYLFFLSFPTSSTGIFHKPCLCFRWFCNYFSGIPCMFLFIFLTTNTTYFPVIICIFCPFFTITMCDFGFYNIIMICYFFLGFLIIIPFSTFTSIVKNISFLITCRIFFIYFCQMISTFMSKCLYFLLLCFSTSDAGILYTSFFCFGWHKHNFPIIPYMKLFRQIIYCTTN